MAKTLTGKTEALIAYSYLDTSLTALGTPGEIGTQSNASTYEDGKGANKVNAVFREQYAVSTTQDIDLYGVLEDIFGDAIPFEQIKSLWFKNLSTTAGDNVLVGPQSVANTLREPWNARAAGVNKIKASGFLLIDAPIDGWDVEATSKIIRLTYAGTSGSVAVQFVVLGQTGDLEESSSSPAGSSSSLSSSYGLSSSSSSYSSSSVAVSSSSSVAYSSSSSTSSVAFSSASSSSVYANFSSSSSSSSLGVSSSSAVAVLSSDSSSQSSVNSSSSRSSAGISSSSSSSSLAFSSLSSSAGFSSSSSLAFSSSSSEGLSSLSSSTSEGTTSFCSGGVFATGAVTPDCTGCFYYMGELSGQSYYENGDWRLVWDGVSTWSITSNNAELWEYYWERINAILYGEYEPRGLATGTVII